ncbi:MAG: tryptophan--tRNA ligase [Dehalococcoidia bacterium]|nr:tryptophan--tRNA ligase [Dehalococcoidia bacterium]
MLEQTARKRLFSGIQPTGELHLGNYIGALTLWAEQQHQYASVFCVVDLHAITIPEAIKPEYLRRKTREAAAILMASGIDPEESAIFIQSQIPAHTELTWILNCVTPLGWLERMTQFKSKSTLAESVGTGLLDYPVLQAADVLLYKTNVVPVGEDQRQHVELMTDIAQRFNHLYGEAFVLPQAMIRASGARVMGLDDPTVKMSKSLGEKRKGHAIGVVDQPDVIRQAIMRAVTDSGKETHFESASPGVKNLLVIYEVLSGQTREEIEGLFEGKGYGVLKKAVADLVIASLEPVRNRYDRLMAEPERLEELLRGGADRVRPIADATLKRVKELVGLG